MAEQYIFTIENLTKAYGKREVLKDIWLAFYPGAKIGVIGSNGAGKTSILRVMALEDKEFMGSARPADRISIGYVPQEPRLDESKDVKGNIEEAVAATRALLTKHEDLSNKLSAPVDPDTMERILEELGRVVFEATARGLVVHQMIGILPERARSLYHIPEGVQPLTGLAIGYVGDPNTLPDKLKERDLAPRTRKPLAEFVFGGE